jgi:hypothetical protein
VHPYVTMTRRAAMSSAIHARIFGVTYDGGMVLATAVTVESCPAVTPAKTMSVTIVILMRCCWMKMATETVTLTHWNGIDFADDLIDEF